MPSIKNPPLSQPQQQPTQSHPSLKLTREAIEHIKIRKEEEPVGHNLPDLIVALIIVVKNENTTNQALSDKISGIKSPLLTSGEEHRAMITDLFHPAIRFTLPSSLTDDGMKKYIFVIINKFTGDIATSYKIPVNKIIRQQLKTSKELE